MKIAAALTLLCFSVLATAHSVLPESFTGANAESEQPPYKVLKTRSYEERLYYEGASQKSLGVMPIQAAAGRPANKAPY
jgi:hypothetical protein